MLVGALEFGKVKKKKKDKQHTSNQDGHTMTS